MNIQILNIFFGCAATVYPLLAAYYFRSSTNLGKAVSYMFIGESVGMAITLLFAILAYTNNLQYLDSGLLTHIMRSIMFIVAITTSFHLGFVIKEIIEKKNVS